MSCHSSRSEVSPRYQDSPLTAGMSSEERLPGCVNLPDLMFHTGKAVKEGYGRGTPLLFLN